MFDYYRGMRMLLDWAMVAAVILLVAGIVIHTDRVFAGELSFKKALGNSVAERIFPPGNRIIWNRRLGFYLPMKKFNLSSIEKAVQNFDPYKLTEKHNFKMRCKKAGSYTIIYTKYKNGIEANVKKYKGKCSKSGEIHGYNIPFTYILSEGFSDKLELFSCSIWNPTYCF